MFASTTTMTARPQSINRGLRYVEEVVMPALPAIPGFVGLSALVDRATGRCIITTSWHSAEALQAAEDRVRPFRERWVAAFDATDTPGGEVATDGTVTVDRWEVALMHRAHTSDITAGAHVSWFEGDPETMGELIDAFRAAIPDLEQLPGFASASLLVDRAGGRAVSTVVYDAPAMAAARPQENKIRTSVADAARAYVIEVAEFELAISHLRVPELV